MLKQQVKKQVGTIGWNGRLKQQVVTRG